MVRQPGHDVLAARDKMRGADDAAVLSRGAAEERILVTNDKDLGELAVRGRHAHAGILLLRLRDEGAASRVRVFENLNRSADLLAG
jgi:predicted nuclease of predicted toxin-antitoxin system